ncbi:MAG TPA: methionyl-tRNA formyltransferase [Thermoanaerobaculia bacterium]|nr:methionyl-tRNA formyltransferase [Thermoanaerobaculia bacterium]
MAAIDRIVFFGTPGFALPALEALVSAGRAPVLVVSQPARPAGRGRRLVEPSVVLRAAELGLPVAQPERVRAPEFLDRLDALAPDLAVVVAFGQIFPERLLDLPRLGCVNVHASLLPRWRGAAPIAAAIAAGDAETGVSIQRMEAGLDTGPVFAERRLAIGVRETAGELGERLARAGAELLLEVLAGLERGGLEARPQDAARSTYAPKLAGALALELERPAAEVDRSVRAHLPDPGAYVRLGEERIKVLDLRPGDEGAAGEPGTVVGVAGDGLRVATGAGTTVDLLRVQRPGGRPMSGRDLANGLRLVRGLRLA